MLIEFRLNPSRMKFKTPPVFSQAGFCFVGTGLLWWNAGLERAWTEGPLDGVWVSPRMGPSWELGASLAHRLVDSLDFTTRRASEGPTGSLQCHAIPR
ncbi:hypothetical protein RISK_002933 [Rhodopirellula islandica]|uniref:Uncharacterized protein n=1 Tax=Rhodopirellula islandica TaxID=595434 RepID=A0A0J1BF80_RHOIS|nr:hypothetical protein RISK_002933 [Rhodopirellula islandica]